VVHLRSEACAGLDASQLAEMASQAKHHAKEIVGGSLYLIDGVVERVTEGELGLSV
jgi:L-2-hydroxyglutarate oxidase LhgO